jgi:hypothetical protein
MSAFSARKSDPVIGEFYRRLVSGGKTLNRLMTACMREPLALVPRQGRPPRKTQASV